jgi:hypothetical protein
VDLVVGIDIGRKIENNVSHLAWNRSVRFLKACSSKNTRLSDLHTLVCRPWFTNCADELGVGWVDLDGLQLLDLVEEAVLGAD